MPACGRRAAAGLVLVSTATSVSDEPWFLRLVVIFEKDGCQTGLRCCKGGYSAYLGLLRYGRRGATGAGKAHLRAAVGHQTPTFGL